MAKERFEVSTKGMRALQAGREPWQLAKELVANAWDEPTVTRCEITLKSTDVRKAILTTYDNGRGFSNIADAWTLMGHTAKRGEPTVRGRFNIGEKEIISVAIYAKVQTSGKIINFPKSGGRIIKDAINPMQGTMVDCWLPWGNRQVETTIAKLKELLPPKGITYIVNDETVAYREPTQTIETTLDTVLQDSPTEPIRPTQRKTEIELYPNENGKLYEMGIPIQPIQCPYLVNVMQKVPMPPNRDVVRDSYLQDIYKAILEATVENLLQEQAAETWVRTAIEDKDIASEIVKKAMVKRFGDKVVLWSTDQKANEQAIEHGYEVIHGKTLSSAEREAMTNVGLVHSSDIFTLPTGTADAIPESEWTDDMKQVAEYAKRLAKELIQLTWLRVEMYKMPNAEAAATYSCGTISFNISKLGYHWFDSINPSVTSLILHELGHHRGNGHDWVYDKSFQRIAGEAVHLALEKPELFKVGRNK